MRLAGLKFPISSFLVFLKTRVARAFFQNCGTAPNCHDAPKMGGNTEQAKALDIVSDSYSPLH